MFSLIACAALYQSSFRSLNSQVLPHVGDDFWFIAMGDNRPAGAGIPPTRTFRQLIEEAGIIGPAFVISSGDLVYGNEETLDQYKQEIAWMKPILQTLPCPFYNAPGNHEINNRKEFLDTYTKAFGGAYGAFEAGKFRFIGLCTEFPSDAPSIFGSQLDWLKRTLDGSKPAVIFQHHPIYARKTNEEKASSTVSNARELHEIYKSGGVKLVVEGHDHIYDAQNHDGIDYRIAGGAGAPLDGEPADGGYYHLMLVHVKGTNFDATPIPAGTLEVVPIKDGVVAAANYAYMDLPVTNVLITSTFKPRTITADISSKKGKKKKVEGKIVSVTKVGKQFVTRIAITLTRARATYIRLGS